MAWHSGLFWRLTVTDKPNYFGDTQTIGISTLRHAETLLIDMAIGRCVVIRYRLLKAFDLKHAKVRCEVCPS
jgi:hypothetical protein